MEGPNLPNMCKSYFIGMGLWILLLFLFSIFITMSPPVLVFIMTVIISTPLALVYWYESYAQKKQKLLIFHKKGILYRLLSGLTLSMLTNTIYAILVGGLFLIGIRLNSVFDWLMLLLVLLLYPYVFRFTLKRTREEIINPISVKSAIIWSAVIVSIIATIIYILWLAAQIKNLGSEDYTLGNIMRCIIIYLQQNIPSSSVKLVYTTSSTFEAIKTYIAHKALSLPNKYFLNYIVAIVILLAGTWGSFYFSCVAASAFLIDKSELLKPLVPEDKPKKILTRSFFYLKKIIAVAIALLISFGIYIKTDDFLRSSEKKFARIGNFVLTEWKLKAEQVGENFYKQGTISKIEKITNANKEEVKEIANAVVDKVFDKMEENVDTFLDWYYSITGDMARTAWAIGGLVGEKVTQKLVETLTENGKLFKEMEDGISSAVDENSYKTYQAIQNTLKHNFLGTEESLGQVPLIVKTTRYVSFTEGLKKILTPPKSFKGEYKAVVVTGGAIAGWRLGKKAVELIERELVNRFGRRFILRGALSGTVKLSAEIVGGILGGILIDAILLSIEELMYRDEFKQQILQTLEEWRQATKESVNNSLDMVFEMLSVRTMMDTKLE